MKHRRVCISGKHVSVCPAATVSKSDSLRILVGLVGLAVAMACLESPAGQAEVGLVVPIIAEPSAHTWQAVRGAGGANVAFYTDSASGDLAERIDALAAAATRQNFKLWIAWHGSADDAVAVARVAASPLLEGVALIMPPPEGDPPAAGDLRSQLAIKQEGDRRAEVVRQARDCLGKEKKLALVVGASEILPETARGPFLPIKDLVRDGTVDLVCLSGAEGYNFHRLRVLRDDPLRAGSAIDGRGIDEARMAGMIARGVLASLQNRTSDCLWLIGVPPELGCRVAADTMESHRRWEANAAALRNAIAAGEVLVDQQVASEGATDQATVHGVAQSFVPSADAECPLVEIFAAIRGCQGPLPAGLVVQIREDGGGKPGETILANAEIPAIDFGHEPTYRWVAARFAQPVPLRKGSVYWIYLPDTVSQEGSYVWRMRKDGAGASGHAWSRRYDYASHVWVYRVYRNRSLSQNRFGRGGQAHFAPRTPQNEPVPNGFEIGSKETGR